MISLPLTHNGKPPLKPALMLQHSPKPGHGSSTSPPSTFLISHPYSNLLNFHVALILLVHEYKTTYISHTIKRRLPARFFHSKISQKKIFCENILKKIIHI